LTLAATFIVIDMRIGDLAKRAGTTTRALRFYETQGLITARRSKNGYREYNDDDFQLVKEIQALQGIGFSLEDADLAWVDLGFQIAEPTFLLLVIATVIAWRRTKSDGPSVAGRIATGLVGFTLVAYRVALWAMTTKPV
jgi:hypothetical protein